MAAATPGGRTILVTDAGRGSAIAIIRSLGRQGWRVIAADSDPGSLGFRSRYVSERVLHPSPLAAPGEFVESIIEAVSRHGVELIIPVTDAAILPLSAQRDRVLAACPVAMPDAEALRMVVDKRRTLDLGASLGIPAPRSELARSSAEALRLAGEMGWPVVLKPKSSRIYRDGGSIEIFEVAYANSADELMARLAPLEGRSDVLVQEYCAGEGHGIGLLMDAGRPLAAFQHRRLHEVPLSGGASSLRESVALDPVLLDHSVRLLGALNWTGLAMVEFKVGPKGPRLMEVNGRVWGSLPLAISSGVDFPRLLADLYLGPAKNGKTTMPAYRLGVRARNLDLDVLWIAATLSGQRRYPYLSTPGRAEGLAGLLGLADPRSRMDGMAWDDPAPGIAEIPRIASKMWRKLRRRSEPE